MTGLRHEKAAQVAPAESVVEGPALDQATKGAAAVPMDDDSAYLRMVTVEADSAAGTGCDGGEEEPQKGWRLQRSNLSLPGARARGVRAARFPQTDALCWCPAAVLVRCFIHVSNSH
jgi:hypothetical protein